MRVGLGGSAIGRTMMMPVSVPFGLLALLWQWAQNSRSRQALRNLPPYLHDDVGLTRAQAEAESLKRFWMK